MVKNWEIGSVAVILFIPVTRTVKGYMRLAGKYV